MTTWAVWFVAAMIVFACIEGFALVTRRIPTLLATIWQLTKRQPLPSFAIGLVEGGRDRNGARLRRHAGHARLARI